MIRLSVIIGCCFVLGLSVSGQAQNLINQPESVVFDTLFERYLISNWWDGAIIEMDSEGVQGYFATGENCQAGLEIVDDVVYVGCSHLGVKGFDLYTGELVAHVVIPGSVLLNDVTADTSGNLYVSDPYADKIFKIRLSDLSYSTLVDPIVWPNGLYYDRHNDRLLACGSTTRNIYSVDRDDGTLTFITQAEAGHLDGIAQDSAGNIYISAQGVNFVYRYDSAFSQPPETVYRSSELPADIFYNKRDNILAVPNILDVSVNFVDFSVPDLYWCGLSVIDSMDESSDRLHPGERFHIYPIIGNRSYTARGVEASLKSHDYYVTVFESEATFSEDLPRDAKVASTTPFEVSVLPDCPVPHVAVLALQITADDGYIKEDSILLFIGDTDGFYDDMEGNAGFWRHRSAKRLYRDTWYREDECINSGTQSWKPGNAIAYYSFTDGELISEPFLLAPRSSLSMWHRIGAEEGTEPGTAWDGALVYIQTMDGEKVQITPNGGYTHTTLVAATSPLRAETPVFSGNYDWAEARFDLSDFSGVVQLIFCFTSNGTNTGTGWCIDDVEVAIDQEICCIGQTGNVDFDPDEIVDIGDLTVLIDFLFINFVEPDCMNEANVDGTGTVDIGDLTALISYLFIPPFTAPEACP